MTRIFSWFKSLFRKTPLDYVQGVEYNINEDSVVTCNISPFEGIRVNYSDVFIDSADEQVAKLSFHYTIIENNGISQEKLLSSECKKILGDILLSIIWKKTQEEAEINNESDNVEFEPDYSEEP